ncbi:MAG: C39 family peptidase [Thermaerobacter sp.]|nr:C39 family peptidase [Thermaerobacter sp.]
MKTAGRVALFLLLCAVMVASLQVMREDFLSGRRLAPASRQARAETKIALPVKASDNSPAPAPARFLRDAIVIEGVPVVHQMPRWPTGCEVVSIKMLAEFYGVSKSVDEWIARMPQGDIYWRGGRRHGPDPRQKFAGSPYSVHSYGVYHQPMLAMLKPYFGDRLVNMTGRPWGEYEDMIIAGNPIAIWGTIENLPVVLRGTWLTPAGDEYQWRGNGHTMLLVGFSKTEVVVNDPYTGRQRRFDKEVFLQRWAAMGQQGIAIRP